MSAIIPKKSMDSLFQGMKLKLFGNNVASYFRQYADCHTALQKLSQQMDVFATFLVQHNLGVSAQFFPFKFPVMNLAEIAIKPKEEVHVSLMDGLQKGIIALRDKVIATLDDLVAQNQIGLIEWKSDTVCRLSYFTAIHKDTFVRQYVQGNQRITGKERTHVHLMHIHDVMDAEQIPLPAGNVKMPNRVRALIKEFPETLHPFGRVVIGQEIAKQTAEVNRHREIISESEFIPEPVYQRDPALILGHYVLAGWENGEE